MTAPTSPTTIAITGASRGLGAALARAYAAPGRHLWLAARTEAALAPVVADCTARGARVTAHGFEGTNANAAEAWIGAIAAAGPLDLLIVNAGIFGGRRQRDVLEPADGAAAILDINLKGAVAVAQAAARAMIGRRSGRIALISSLAAWHPLADAPAYSASKAGLVAWGEAMREALARHDVGMSIVLPGHIRTDQTAQQMGAQPLLMAPESAALRIKAGLDRGRPLIVFPRRLALLIKLGRLVPWRLRAWLGRGQRFHVVDRS